MYKYPIDSITGKKYLKDRSSQKSKHDKYNDWAKDETDPKAKEFFAKQAERYGRLANQAQKDYYTKSVGGRIEYYAKKGARTIANLLNPTVVATDRISFNNGMSKTYKTKLGGRKNSKWFDKLY